MKKTMIAIVLVLNLTSSPVLAGVPVLSPSELVQAVLEYTQILKDYEEQLTQVSQGYEQIAQLQREYEQALREYDHLLEQAQAYKDKWGSYNWNNFLDEMAHNYANKTTKSNSELEQDSTYWKNKTLYVTKYGKVISWGQVKGQIDSLKMINGDEYTENVNTLYNEINSGVDRIGTYINMNDYVASQLDYMQEMELERLNLGENSQLATLQFLTKQNEEMMKMQLQKIQFDAEQIRISNEKNDIKNNKNINRQYQELLKIEDNLNKPLTYDNSRINLGKF